MEAFKNTPPPKKNNSSVTVEEIKKVICDYYSISNQQLVGSSRTTAITIPRHIAIYLCRKLLNMTFEDIGVEFGNRDHTTIMNSVIKIEKAIEEEQAYKLVINKIQQMLTK